MTDDALDLGMLGISGDQYQGILRLVSDDFLNLANIRAGGIYIGDAVFFERFIDAVRYAVGADDDQDLFGFFQCQQLGQLFDSHRSQGVQLLDHLRVVDDFSQGVQLWRFGAAAFFQLPVNGIDSAAYAEAEAGCFGNGNRHGNPSFLCDFIGRSPAWVTGRRQRPKSKRARRAGKTQGRSSGG